jgi:hypothetical protein
VWSWFFTLFSGAIGMSMISVYFTVLLYGTAVIWWTFWSYVNARRGIDVHTLFLELPPE